MPGNGTARSGVTGQDHDQADLLRLPATLAGDHPGHDAPLSIHSGQQGLDIHDGSLDLDEQESRTPRVPGKYVDGAALAVVAEGVFDDRLPAAPAEVGHHRFDELGVPYVE